MLPSIANWPVPHAAVAVVRPNAGVDTGGLPDHVFRLASVTKMLTSYATLVAVEEGSVSLDQAAGPPGATIRHLLSHAAGYGFESDSGVVGGVGRRRIYSNQGIEVLAATVATATAMPFDTYLVEAVLQPLGMTSTTLRGSAAYEMWSNVFDLVLFAAELLTPTLVAPETVADMATVQFPGLAGVLPGIGRFDDLGWGLGVEIKGSKAPHWSGSLTSPRTFGHFGGSGTFIWVDPTQRLATIALTDRDFGEWAMRCWSEFSDAVVTTYGR